MGYHRFAPVELAYMSFPRKQLVFLFHKYVEVELYCHTVMVG